MFLELRSFSLSSIDACCLRASLAVAALAAVVAVAVLETARPALVVVVVVGLSVRRERLVVVLLVDCDWRTLDVDVLGTIVDALERFTPATEEH